MIEHVESETLAHQWRKIFTIANKSFYVSDQTLRKSYRVVVRMTVNSRLSATSVILYFDYPPHSLSAFRTTGPHCNGSGFTASFHYPPPAIIRQHFPGSDGGGLSRLYGWLYDPSSNAHYILIRNTETENSVRSTSSRLWFSVGRYLRGILVPQFL